MVAGGKEKVLKFFEMQSIQHQDNSSMTPSEIKVLKYNLEGNRVYCIGPKFLRCYQCMDENFKALENIDIPMTLTDIEVTKDGFFGIGFYSQRIFLFKKSKSKRVNKFKLPQVVKEYNKNLTEDDELEEVRDMMKNHEKIIKLSENKINGLTPIINFWFMQKNSKATLIAL